MFSSGSGEGVGDGSVDTRPETGRLCEIRVACYLCGVGREEAGKASVDRFCTCLGLRLKMRLSSSFLVSVKFPSNIRTKYSEVT